MKGTNHTNAPSRRIAKRPEGGSGMGKATKQPKSHSIWSATGRNRVVKDSEG